MAVKTLIITSRSPPLNSVLLTHGFVLNCMINIRRIWIAPISTLEFNELVPIDSQICINVGSQKHSHHMSLFGTHRYRRLSKRERT
jgi:hypothetical protein